MVALEITVDTLISINNYMANRIKLYDVLDNTKNIYMSDNALENLLDFERVLDNLDLYVFENWDKGELVEGPYHGRHFVECSFMWPEKMMPNPLGAKRLLDYGIKVTFEKSKLTRPIKNLQSYPKHEPLNDESNYEKIKTLDTPIWIVTIKMPRELMTDIERGSIEYAGETVDLQDVEDAEQQNLDQAAAAPEMEMEQL